MLQDLNRYTDSLSLYVATAINLATVTGDRHIVIVTRDGYRVMNGDTNHRMFHFEANTLFVALGGRSW